MDLRGRFAAGRGRGRDGKGRREGRDVRGRGGEGEKAKGWSREGEK